jgi:hypothetical protein
MGASFYRICEVKVKNMKNKNMYYKETVQCKIWGSHGSEHEDGSLLGCSATWSPCPYDRSIKYLWYASKLLPANTMPQPKRQPSSNSGLQAPNISVCKSQKGPLPYRKNGAELEGNNWLGSLL